MKFSLFELLVLTIPAAFLCLWIANFLRSEEIEWQEFSLNGIAQTQNDEKSALVLCVPEMFWNGDAWSGTVDPELPRIVDMAQLDAFRYEYRYWTQSGPWPPPTKWIIDRGAGKEPSLILISRDGTTKNIRGFNFGRDEIIDFLDLERRKISTEKFSLWLFVLSLTTAGAIVVWYRKQTPIAR